MPAHISTATAQDTAADDHRPVTVAPGVEFLYRVAERFGLPVVLLILVLWWARTDIVQPLLDAHFGVVRQIVDGQKEHTKQLENVGRKLDELIEISQ